MGLFYFLFLFLVKAKSQLLGENNYLSHPCVYTGQIKQDIRFN